MRIRIICIALLLFIFVEAKANPVSEMQAREVGFKFLNATQKMNVKDVDALHLVKTYRCATGEASFYVFNTSTGYVIVSADDVRRPYWDIRMRDLLMRTTFLFRCRITLMDSWKRLNTS